MAFDTQRWITNTAGLDPAGPLTGAEFWRLGQDGQSVQLSIATMAAYLRDGVVAAAVAALVNSAPGQLDTLKELADALADDASFASTMTTALAAKQPLNAKLTTIAALASVSNLSTLANAADPSAFTVAALASQNVSLASVTASAALQAGTTLGISTDVLLNRDAGDVLAQRRAGNAQAFRVYNTYTDGSNYERAKIGWASNVLSIGAEAAGTGTQRALTLFGASINLAFGATPTTAWQLNSSGHFLAAADNTYDIGASGANRPRALYIAGAGAFGGVVTFAVAPVFTDVSGTRSALSLGTAATQNTGTSGAVLPFANAANTWLLAQTFTAAPVFTDQSGTRAALSIASMALQAASAVAITGGTLAGITSDSHTSAGTIDWSSDLYLARDAAAVLAQRNSTNAQTSRIYNTYTDASNYERAKVGWASNVLSIGAEAAGTGTQRALTLFGASINLAFGATPTTAWQLNSSGHWLAATDNTYDIGASGATRPRNLYVAGTGIFGGVVTLSVAPVFTDQSGTRTALSLGTAATQNTGTSGAVLPFANAANTWLLAQTFTAAPVFTDASGSRSALGLGSMATQAASAVAITGGTLAGITAAGLSSAATLDWNSDLYLARDAADVSAQRRSTNAQTARFYNTYTDASNYERAKVGWASNVLSIGAEAAGTGTQRALTLFGASINLAFGATPTTAWQLNSSGHFLAATDNTYDIGASGATRPRAIYAATQIVTPQIGNAAGVIGIEGVSGSYPGLKRSGTALQARIADDSNYCILQGKLRTAGNAVTGLTAGALAATTNASIVISDANGNDYRIPCII